MAIRHDSRPDRQRHAASGSSPVRSSTPTSSQFDDLRAADRLEMSAFNLAHAGDLQARASRGSPRRSRATSVPTRFQRRQDGVLSRCPFTECHRGRRAGRSSMRGACATVCRTRTPELTSSQVRDAAGALGRMLKRAHGCGPLRFIAAPQTGHATLDDLNGLGIFAPFVTDDEVAARIELNDLDADRSVIIDRRNKGRNSIRAWICSKYPEGERGRRWCSTRFVGRSPPTSLPQSTASPRCGVGDRADVAQIVMGIESSLNQLDRASDKPGGILSGCCRSRTSSKVNSREPPTRTSPRQRRTRPGRLGGHSSS
jgi:hypothetical protein